MINEEKAHELYDYCRRFINTRNIVGNMTINEQVSDLALESFLENVCEIIGYAHDL